MSKLFKFGLAFILIGLAAVLIITNLTNTQIFGLEDDSYTLYEETYDYDSFNEIDFNFHNRKVFILESEDENIHLSYYLHEKDTLVFDDSTEKLELSITRKWYFSLFSMNIFSDTDHFLVYLYLPTSSNINIVDVVSSNGKVELTTNNNFENINLATSNGDIIINNCTSNSISADSSNGAIKIENVIVNGLINMDTSNGPITLNNVVADQIEGETSNGRIYAEKILSDNISLESSNGKVFLEAIGDKDYYRVTLSTSNGDKIYDGLEVESSSINLSGEKIIRLDSSNGDVEVRFVE